MYANIRGQIVHGHCCMTMLPFTSVKILKKVREQD